MNFRDFLKKGDQQVQPENNEPSQTNEEPKGEEPKGEEPKGDPDPENKE